MEETEPFSGIKTYDSYGQPALLFLFAGLVSVALSLAAMFFLNRLLKSGLESSEITGFVQGAVYTLACINVLKGMGVDFRAVYKDWKAKVRSDAAAAMTVVTISSGRTVKP